MNFPLKKGAIPPRGRKVKSVREAGYSTHKVAVAAAIPGMTVHVDENGVETQRFQSETSGQAVLYAQSGQLMFHGGITFARGHGNDNPGVDPIESLLWHKSSVPGTASTPVFGCELFGSCTRPGTLENALQNNGEGAV
jgi:hypothetical protein